MTARNDVEESRLERPTGAPPLYSQDGLGYEAIVRAHYFLSSSDWLVTEYDPEEDVAFGWAMIGGDRRSAELGYVSVAELDSVRAPIKVQLPNGDTSTTVVFGYARVELDKHWPEGLTLRQAVARLDEAAGR